MPIINNIIKIPKNNSNLSSEYIENELKKRGYFNILRWAILEVGNNYLKINFANETEQNDNFCK